MACDQRDVFYVCFNREHYKFESPINLIFLLLWQIDQIECQALIRLHFAFIESSNGV
jgi:hypothetical protein